MYLLHARRNIVAYNSSQGVSHGGVAVGQRLWRAQAANSGGGNCSGGLHVRRKGAADTGVGTRHRGGERDGQVGTVVIGKNMHRRLAYMLSIACST